MTFALICFLNRQSPQFLNMKSYPSFKPRFFLPGFHSHAIHITWLEELHWLWSSSFQLIALKLKTTHNFFVDTFLFKITKGASINYVVLKSAISDHFLQLCCLFATTSLTNIAHIATFNNIFALHFLIFIVDFVVWKWSFSCQSTPTTITEAKGE